MFNEIEAKKAIVGCEIDENSYFHATKRKQEIEIKILFNAVIKAINRNHHRNV